MSSEKINEKLLWSIAFPGFGQLLNKKYFKGTILLFLEFLINVQAHFNQIIMFSFNGEIVKAVQYADYQWLLFYPCIYFYAIWDAYKDAGGGNEPYSFIPFVFAAYFVTVGVIYSKSVVIFGTLLGPVWLPIFCLIPGLLIGLFIKKELTRRLKE
ncbi:hypothetical protein [Gracilibacillus sp. YIM 98692]|uniref:hypothetical protein n=1 Tax=Gracilibacillus sp. YIM 98692 TaxID=2663532 RepID=UPI0013D6D64F|nr:hypothetical protein [Gracilibacillus sp. YIM 98692]